MAGELARLRRLSALLGVLSVWVAGAGWMEWEELHRDAELIVETQASPENGATLRGRTELPHPAEAVHAVLLDLASFPRWGRSLVHWEVLSRSPDEAIVYGRHDMPWPLADRDYVVRYTWQLATDRFRLEARSTEYERAPVADDAVRLTRVHSIWEVTPAGPGRASVTYTYDGDLGDLGGTVPEALRRWATVSQLRDLFARLARETAAREG